MERVLIVGGGIAGLTAAMQLADDCETTVIEGRERLGGRILTVRGESDAVCELGAEFVHGSPPLLRELIANAKLSLQKVPDRHWRFDGERLVKVRDFWGELEKVTGQIDPASVDESFARFLRSVPAPAESKQLAREFVEGFHAADPSEAGIHALHHSESSSEELKGNEQHRITDGYGALVAHCEKLCLAKGVRFHTRTVVERIAWSRGRVKLLCKGAISEIEARRVVVTVPIGVLQAGGLRFDPAIPEKEAVIQRFRMGVAYKIVLEFNDRFWPKDLGFIHAKDDWFFTWWADERSNILVGWSGGPKAEELSTAPRDVTETHAVDSLSRILGQPASSIRDALIGAHHHNWREDPFAHGAYSYLPVDAADAPFELAKPVADTIYFAGEATDFTYQLGTVHAAIASGHRVTREIRAAQGYAV